MERYDIFRDISERTGGSIYMGVVGPVRTGKSTFIKRFMDLLVLPNIRDEHARQRDARRAASKRRRPDGDDEPAPLCAR